MAYIWQNKDWPSYSYDRTSVEKALKEYNDSRLMADAVFGVLDEKTRMQIQARSIADEIVSSLEIEGERISFESVYSSVTKRLDVMFDARGRNDAYADSVSSIAFDAIGNRNPMTKARLDSWNRALFENSAGIKPKSAGSYREGPEYIVRQTSRGPDVVYTAVPPEKVAGEMERLLLFVNSENEDDLLVKGSIAALWFVIIHPYADGNGRMSRALSDYILSGNGGSRMKTYSISSLILSERKDYYAAIGAVSNQSTSLDLTDWIIWNIDIARKANERAVETLKKTIRLTGFMKSLDPSVFNSREIFMLYRLADGSFFGKLTTEKWAKMTKCSSAAAQRDIRHLVDEGYLVPDGDRGPKTGYLLNTGIV